MLFAAGVAFLGVLWLWSLRTPAFEGDLTRVALLSEHAFGPRDPQPIIAADLRVSAPLDAADVLVLGDSFSAGRQWQAALVATGLRVATLHHRETVGWCAGIFDWVRRKGFRGHTLIIQSVERELADQLKSFERCATPRQGVSAAPAPGTEGMAPPGASTGSPALFTGLMSHVNTRLALLDDRSRVLQAWGGGTRVRVRALPNGCDVFSHRHCQRGLFLATDEERPHLSDESLRAMARLHAVPRDMRLIWMVLPNKSTLYLRASGFDRFAKALAERGLGVDLWSVLASLPDRDVYLPNDTHLSNTGHLAVGHAMVAAVAR
jgi:hypothetical protein